MMKPQEDEQQQGRPVVPLLLLLLFFKSSLKILNRIEEDLEDIVSLVQDGDVDAIKSLPQSLSREYICN